MPWWSRSRRRLVPLSEMSKPHLVAAFKRLSEGRSYQPEGTDEDSLRAEFREEFDVRMMDHDGRKWDPEDGG